MTPKEISTFIKNAREKKGISLRDLSQATGVDKNLISNFENGKSNPCLNTVCKILSGLDCKLKITE